MLPFLQKMPQMSASSNLPHLPFFSILSLSPSLFFFSLFLPFWGGGCIHTHVIQAPLSRPKAIPHAGSSDWKNSSGWKNVRTSRALAMRRASSRRKTSAARRPCSAPWPLEAALRAFGIVPRGKRRRHSTRYQRFPPLAGGGTLSSVKGV